MVQRSSRLQSTAISSTGTIARRRSSFDSATNLFQRDRFRIYLDETRFAVCWWLVMLAHASALTFLLAMVYLYYWLLTVPSAREGLLPNITFAFSYQVLSVMVSVFALIAILHGFDIGSTLYSSFKARELTFGSDLQVASRLRRMTTLKLVDSSADRSSFGSRWRCCSYKFWRKTYQKWIVPVFYIHGKYFQHYFLTREYLEVISQVYQSYQMSIHISSVWINKCYVGNLVLNCVSTPLVHKLVPPSKEPLRRLIAVTCSAFLSFINSVVIPLVVFLPYVRAYDPDLRYFPMTFTFNEVWYARALRENQQLFVTTYLDFVFTSTPHWGLLSCLRICESLLCRRQKHLSKRSRTTAFVVLPSINAAPALLTNDADPTDHRLHVDATRSTASSEVAVIPPKRNVLVIFEHLLWIIGLVVLGVHIAAQRTSRIEGCKLQGMPWFASNMSCVIMNVNCSRRGIEGTRSQIEEALQGLNSDTLFQLILSHCPALQIPPIIQSYHHLGGLDMYNVTLDQWDLDAAITQQHHPEMDYVDIVRSNMSSVPEGILHDALPDRLLEIYFYEANLTTLPHEVEDYWHSIEFLGMEKCQFEAFPFRTRAKLQPSNLYFTGNPITTIDEDVFADNQLLVVFLSNPQLRSLPNETSGHLQNLFRLYLQFTQLTFVPLYIREWYDTHEGVDHSLFGTPYCQRELSDAQEQKYQEQVCDTSKTQAAGFHFQIELIARQR